MSCRLKISQVILFLTVLFSLESIALVSPAAARDLLHPTNYTDLEALLSIKSHIGNDPFGFLATWNDSLHFCQWEGVACSTRPQRVITLDLFQKGLGGALSPYVGNLTFLKYLQLGENDFTGVIPQEIGRLYRLQNMSLYHNSFHGEIPKNLTKCSALTEIYFDSNFLEGEIPSQLSSLSDLQVLRLSKNNLRGSIPSSLGNLSSLRILSLSFNNLEGSVPTEFAKLSNLESLLLAGNNFTGVIPQGIGRLYRLQNISLYSNSFQGEIPKNLTKCSALREISLDSNFLEGSIPSSLGNLSALRTLVLSFNNLKGSIPTEFAKLSNLEYLLLSSNNLSGPLATGIFNISSIHVISLALNQLKGSLPWDFGLHVPKLEYFSVDQNQFSGPLPASVTNASRLQVLDIGLNSFSGPVPMSIGNLLQLERLVLSGNPLGTLSIGLKFLTSLSNCSNLKTLHLDENNHRDNLPRSIANLSTELISLRLDGNNISGHIPESIGILINLQGLYLSRNKFTRGIPSSIGGIRSLTILEMQENMLDGVIPVSLGNCTRLSKLNLSHNRLTGGVPREILSSSSALLDLCLAQNQLSGLLPMEVGKLINLARLDVSNNNLSGELPYTLGSCVKLEFLSLRGNHFDGSIPEPFESLKSLQTLDLSSNNFSGKFPANLAKLPFLLKLNLSFNFLEGEVPDEGIFRNITAFSVAGNKKLCASIRSIQLPECKKERPPREREIRFAIVAFFLAASYLIFALLVHICLFYYCTRERKIQTTEEGSNPHVGDHYRKLSYKELCQATDGFSTANLIATGRYSSVYKGILKYSEQKVAVKVLHLQQQGARKGFEAECEALRNTRHRNIVKVITSCSGTDSKGSEFKALVYEFMPNGSLESWIHQSSSNVQQQKNLNLIHRLNIAIDVASAIDYLHHCCEIRIIHRDIKPSNILLDHKLSAHLGDFGSARSVLLPIEKSTHLRIRSSAIGIIGTVGYIALECGMGGPVSTLADVYSYGILLLEMLSGKRPTDSMFIDDFSLHNYVNMNIPDHVMSIADPRLLSEHGTAGQTRKCISLKTERCLASLFHIGIKCSSPIPRDRMDIADALMELKAIRDVFLRVDETENSYQDGT